MKIKFRNILILTLIFALFAALLTNPKKDNYVSWMKEKASAESSNSIEKGLVALLGGPLIKESTQSKNYVLFSVYETSFGEEKIKILGIYNNFIPIGKSTKLDITEKKQGA
ncbi:DUF4359 domain-containing protein [Clostridium swellfunianum]|uniref:DUF4359 domain-containing protein n=1 Tax=Clostridium swellfunianum TaxID=1367462 RepID=UPI0020301723|nr:DUF4359 domain-containing protein [Clostridium swellfunianum]MCM0648605.1 DUF4359 domain-containing protein [Clostridium swellfunianum]